eukprot:GILI01001473.1.p1 GENE.GILI01001473.1~~GILI01001473.1.p1  ORF type:complete len:273 (+),score=58.43 GILI01001473.1:76-894(+)
MYTALHEPESEAPRSRWGRVAVVASSVFAFVGVVALLSMSTSGGNSTNLTSAGGSDMNLNIHVKVPKSSALYGHAFSMSHDINKNDIDFTETHDPHLTFFLTDFPSKSVDAIAQRLRELFAKEKLSGCVAQINAGHAQGAYAMLDGPRDGCIGQLSDKIVEALGDLVSPGAKKRIPSWIKTLPEPMRSEKIDMIHKYGSPNVFSQFLPHVTVGFAPSADSADVKKSFDASFANLPLPQEFEVLEVVVGRTGVGGTVLKDQDLARIPINVHNL